MRQIKSEDILKQENQDYRSLSSFENALISAIAVSWALFQLSLASFLTLDSTKIRAIHLSFAISILFLSVPAIKRPTKRLKYFSSLKGISLIDYIFAILSVMSALYIVIDWQGLALRVGMPSMRDLIFGFALIILLLEATRRAIGLALPVIVILIAAYAFLGPFMPSLFAFKGISLNKFLNQISLSTEGIFGTPLGVSASVVYLFVLLGAMLDKAGAGKFFIDIAIAILGRFKGGAAKASVLASGMMGMISGSSIANVVTVGTFTIPLMKKSGYPAHKAGAIEVASGVNGQLMPPIMGAAAFIMAEYVNIPYVEVARSAIIPAFSVYIALFFVTHFEACKLGLSGVPREELPKLKETLKNGVHYIIPIALLIYELVILRHSPERAAFMTILVLISVIIYQETLKMFKGKRNVNLFNLGKNTLTLILEGFIKGSKNMTAVALATASAGIIVGIVNMGIGGMLNQIVETISGGNIILLLIITMLASLVLGLGLPTTANYIVMASLTAPLIVYVGSIHNFAIPLIAAHMFCFFFGILADDTPPVGLAAYASAAIANSEPIRTGFQGFFYDMRTAIIPFMFVFNPDILLYNVNGFYLSFLIFIMTIVASVIFVSSILGWFIIKNTILESLTLLAASIVLYSPSIVVKILHINDYYKYYCYSIGIALILLVAIIQKIRKDNRKRDILSTTNK